MHLLVGAEKEAFPFVEKHGGRRRAIVRYEVDGFGVNKEFRIDSEPDLDGTLEEVEVVGQLLGLVEAACADSACAQRWSVRLRLYETMLGMTAII